MPIAHFFLRDGLRQRVQSGNHSFFNKFVAVLTDAQFEIVWTCRGLMPLL